MLEHQHELERRAADPIVAEAAPRHAVIERYRLLAAQSFRDSASMGTLAAGILDGSRDGTVEEFAAICSAHDLATRAAGEALTCLGGVAGSEGIG